MQILRHPNFDIPVIVMSAFDGLSILFVYCYYGKSTTDYYLRFGDLAYNLNWHKLPNHLKTHIILMIQNAQRPIQYHGFNIAYLNLETFCQVSFPIEVSSIAKLFK